VRGGTDFLHAAVTIVGLLFSQAPLKEQLSETGVGRFFARTLLTTGGTEPFLSATLRYALPCGLHQNVMWRIGG
jgi:hypothetical protein